MTSQNSLTFEQRRSEDYTGMQRGQARFITYYRFLVLRRHCSVGFRCVYTSRFREIQKRFTEKKSKMVNFCTMHGKKASFFGGHELLFVHCVSKQPLILEGLPCDELLNLKYVVSVVMFVFIVLRIVLCPAVVNGIKIDEMFADCGSPALVQIHSNCVFKVR